MQSLKKKLEVTLGPGTAELVSGREHRFSLSLHETAKTHFELLPTFRV
jgi:hypothetical protein